MDELTIFNKKSDAESMGAQETSELEELIKATETLNKLIAVAGKVVSCPAEPIEIPGIAAADAFDAGDCFGTLFTIAVPKAGIIQSATFYDMDDEGSQVDFEIFKRAVTSGVSDAAYAPSDADMLNLVMELQFFAFDDLGTAQISDRANIGKAYTAPEGKFWIQAICRGTPTIAATNMPKFQLQIIADDANYQEA